MATLYISEYDQIRQAEGGLAQAGQEPAIAEQSVAFTTATASSAFNDKTKIVRAVSDADCFLEFGVAPVATNKKYLPANVVEYFGVIAGQKVSVYDGVS